jgi:glycosyltransferase involved in cell wall biosynthesis
MAKEKVLLNWEINCNFGWGILGLNVFSHWANDHQVMPLSGQTIGNDQVGMLDPLRLSSLTNAIVSSNDYLESIRTADGGPAFVDGVVIDPISHNLPPSTVVGRRSIGRCIFENTWIDEFESRLDRYDHLLCASNWNADIIRARTGRGVSVIFEGVDHSIFCPGPRSGLLDPDKFYIYSGGKIEFRKGQDLVLLAFREFSKRHPDAVLVTAWHSPWPMRAVGFKGRLDAAVELDSAGQLNIKKWASDNGVDPSRVVEIFRVPNQVMPMILREIDVALQPSRAEACTNLPVKEAMACGVPVIVGDNTGMKDLIDDSICVSLHRQSPIEKGIENGTEGWGESDVDEMIDALERLYADRPMREAIGQSASTWIRANRTWQGHAKELKDLVLSIM